MVKCGGTKKAANLDLTQLLLRFEFVDVADSLEHVCTERLVLELERFCLDIGLKLVGFACFPVLQHHTLNPAYRRQTAAVERLAARSAS